MEAIDKHCIIVLGMHRSGTSMLAGCLSLLGYEVSQNLMAATEYNPNGYFENMSVFALNEEILKSGGASWDNVECFEAPIPSTDKAHDFFLSIHKIIDEEYGNIDKIVIKDPRISLFPEFWQMALNQIGYRCHFFISYRNPIEVCQSLYNRDGFSYEKSARLFAHYLRSIIVSLKNLDHSWIAYEDLLSDNNNLIEILEKSRLLGIESEVFKKNIKASFKHHVATPVIEQNVPLFLTKLHQLLSVGKKDTALELIDTVLDSEPTFRDDDQNDLKLEHEKIKKELIEFQDFTKNQLTKQKTDFEFLMREKETLRENQIKNIIDQVESLNEVIAKQKLDRINIERDFELRKLLDEETINVLKNENDAFRDSLRSLKSSLVEVQKEKIQQQTKDLEKIEYLRISKLNLEQKNEQLELEINDVKDSLSVKLGFALTLPLRFIYSLIPLINIKSAKLFPFLIKEIFKNPKLVIRAISPSNLEKLKFAISVEQTDHTKTNIFNYFDKLENINSIGDKGDEIHYNIDEVGRVGKTLILRGWAVSKIGIRSVEISNDKTESFNITYGRSRPDVAIVYPRFSGSVNSGFYFKSDWEEDDVVIKIESKNGHVIVKRVLIEKLENWSSLSLNEQYELFLERKKFVKSETVTALSFQPLISIVVPVYNVKREWLKKCVSSVVNQEYQNWELCLYDDFSTNTETIDTLKEIESFDKRIKVSYGTTNRHIVHATNSAIQMSTGSYIGFLDHDDELSKDALYEVVCTLNRNRALKLIYSDEDKIEMDGRLVEPHFKSNFNLDMLRSNNYISHFTIVERNIGNQAGWLTPGMEGSQDHDLILKIVDLIGEEEVHHIPKVLYHWRKIPGSTAVSYSDKNYAFKAGLKAISNHLKRNNLSGTVERGLWPGSYRVKYNIDAYPFVSIIIPFKDEPELLKTCVDSVKVKTNYVNYEIVLVDNGSKLQASKELLESFSSDDKIRLLYYDVPFNYSQINNWAATKCESDYILLLNNDTEVISQGWLSSMLELGLRKDVGAVGAKLLYEDKTIQHAGVIIGIGGIAGHAHKYLDNELPGYFSRHRTIQNLSACTAACLLVRAELFKELGGLEEKNLKVAFNDIDLCLRIRKLGYLIAYTPYAELFHYESKSRGLEDTPGKLNRFKGEVEYFKSKWGTLLKEGDPYYNTNLSLHKEDFSLKMY